MDSFAFRLKEQLEYKKLTLQAVANALSVSRTAVHKWTRGGEIDYSNLRRLADFLEVNWIWLRYGQEALADIQNTALLEEPPMTDIRRKYTSEIMESEARMQLAQEQARIVTWEWNLLTDEVTYSANTEQVYGWKITCNEDFWPHLPTEDAERLQQLYRETIPKGQSNECDFRIIHPDGSLHWISTRATVLQDSAGRSVKMIGISMDNSERKAAEEALRISEQRFYAESSKQRELIKKQQNYIALLEKRLAQQTRS